MVKEGSIELFPNFIFLKKKCKQMSITLVVIILLLFFLGIVLHQAFYIFSLGFLIPLIMHLDHYRLTVHDVQRKLGSLKFFDDSLFIQQPNGKNHLIEKDRIKQLVIFGTAIVVSLKKRFFFLWHRKIEFNVYFFDPKEVEEFVKKVMDELEKENLGDPNVSLQ